MVAIVGRSQWGAQFRIPNDRFVANSTRRWMVVHWPASAGTIRDERAVWRSIERQHWVGQGWRAAPGYNFGVGQSGTIYEGCGLQVRGIHSPPRNTDGWGVCMIMGMAERMSPAAQNSLRALYAWLGGRAGRQLGQATHSTHWATACAGNEINAWVRAGNLARPGTAPPPQPPPRPQPPDETSEWMMMMANGILEFWQGETGRPAATICWANWFTRDGNARLRFSTVARSRVTVDFMGQGPGSSSVDFGGGDLNGVALPKGCRQVTVRADNVSSPVYWAVSR